MKKYLKKIIMIRNSDNFKYFYSIAIRRKYSSYVIIMTRLLLVKVNILTINTLDFPNINKMVYYITKVTIFE